MTRSSYMQSLMTSTYPMVAVEAIKNGFDKAWERLIAKRILDDYRAGVSEAEVLMSYSFASGIRSDHHAAVNAAILITSSTIQTNEQTT